MPMIQHFSPIDFVWTCPIMKFNETNLQILVETTEIASDKEGFPQIPEECLEACIYYCLYIYHQPMYLTGQIDGQRMSTLERWKNDKIAQGNSSLMMSSLTTNELDSLLDIMTSMGRKTLGFPS